MFWEKVFLLSLWVGPERLWANIKSTGPKGEFPLLLIRLWRLAAGCMKRPVSWCSSLNFTVDGFASLLDIGTGTGILSIVAIKCGSVKVDAIDFNPDCIKVARSNLKRSGCRPASLRVADIHRYPSRKRYDLVAANLVTHNLIKAGRKLVSLVRPGKYLAVSGISLENIPVLKRAFRKYPLRPLKIIKGKEWAAVLYKKHKRK